METITSHTNMEDFTDSRPEGHCRKVSIDTLRQSYENRKLKFQQADEEYKHSRDKAFNFDVKEANKIQQNQKVYNCNIMRDLIRPEQYAVPKKQSYPYELMGDVFSSAPDVVRARTDVNSTIMDNTSRFGRRSGANNVGFTNDFLSHPMDTNHNSNSPIQEEMQSTSKTAVNLPANIRHTFGSRLCDETLSNTILVGQTLDKLEGEKRASNKSKSETPTLLKSPLNPYEDLGHNTRVNLFPGLSVPRTISAAKDTFNESVFLNREPDCDKFRMKRDELSSWSEHNIIRNKMKRQWQIYEESLPVLAVTWDRSATRQPKSIIKSTQPVTKKKPRRQQANINKTNPNPEVVPITDEPEFIFITPPLTPPPPIHSPAKFPESITRDDDFWEFFDQPIPN